MVKKDDKEEEDNEEHDNVFMWFGKGIVELIITFNEHVKNVWDCC